MRLAVCMCRLKPREAPSSTVVAEVLGIHPAHLAHPNDADRGSILVESVHVVAAQSIV